MENIAIHKEVGQSSFSAEQEMLFTKALQAIQVGNTELAEQDLFQIIQHAANPGESYYNIGMAFLEHNHPDKAKDYLVKACHLIPNVCDSFFHLGQCHQKLGELEEAVAHYKSALMVDPKHAEALAYLSLVYYQLNALDLAERATVNWLHAYPTVAAAYNLLGSIYLRRKAYRDAVSQFAQALQFDVTYYEAIVNLGQTNMYLCRYQEAEHYLTRALAIDDRSSLLHTYYGINSLNQRKFKLAKQCFDRAILLDKNNALAYANLSVVLQYHYQFGSGNRAMRQALMLNNKDPSFYIQFAGNLILQNQPEKAIKSAKRALQLSSKEQKAHTLLEQTFLSLGYYEDAWQKRSSVLQQNSLLLGERCLLWNGKPFPGKLLLVYCDTVTEEAILLLRYVPLLANYGRRIALAGSLTLMPLLEQFPHIEQVWLLESDLSKISGVDFQVPLTLLPCLMNTTVTTIPSTFPYLPLNDNMLRTWESILQRYTDSRKKIGIAWLSAVLPNPAQDVPFQVFAAVVKQLSHVSLFNLTSYHSHAQYEWGNHLGLHDIGTRELAALSAIIQQLDCVITSDNLVAHLAGALGKPAYVILPFATKWYWACKENIPLWYPSIRLYRQRIPNQWQDVIACLLSEIKSEV
ncbi:MAG: hypothetical protein K0R12_248 [Gammaproteobacteria bacterium]|jgi:tetratricopeptide (TPR) repeat protein|nr:hypothetical protein [Gammaproteobacteria bacterium]